ncbi:MAG: alkyl hydroperoxide reductase/Thiol specific antioxidant/Mal allergen [Acidobacteriaceae bacterium]|nr:alkyl hydroperoxide reductase/Thiol specific antioxidant/Mal allergen [Acidobacteriaceae bacterium]
MIRSALFVLCLSGAFLCPGALSETPVSTYQSNPKYQAAMAEAKTIFAQRRFSFAKDAYKKASKEAAGQDPVSLKGLYDAELGLGDYKDAAASASQLEAIAGTPLSKASAEIDHGFALVLQAGEKGKPDLLHAADEAFKAAIANEPKSGTAHYYDGQVLARLGQIEASAVEFKQCIACISPGDPSYLRAQRFAANPALSTAKMAPAFQVVALDGSRFNLDAMGGRVVLIDFWATWCGPCKEELPHMKKIAKEFAGQPLVVISVSWDADETKWKSFIEKNEMTWVQYRDADHKLSKNFGVDAIPHYFTIDSDGVLTAEMLGSGSDVEGKLRKLVAKAKAHAAQPSLTATGN